MNNKGFTLVELLLTIAILALIIAIAVPSINGISNIIKENHRKNCIKKIEIAASKYAFDTEETIIFVDKLITEGYLESDDEEGNLIDPVNNERLNCYIVEMEKVSNYYNAKFIDNKNYDKDGVCDLEKLEEDNREIKIEILNNGSTITNKDWVSGNVTLRAYSSNVLINCEINRCEWTSNSGANIVGSDSINLNNINNVLRTKYTFQITIFDENSSIKRYSANVDLKIDNEAPIIYDEQLFVSNKFIYSDFKEVNIIASDGNGSGIVGYYLDLNNGQSCYNTENIFQSSNKFTVNENGNYLICVKDKSGNISSYNGLTIKYIR